MSNEKLTMTNMNSLQRMEFEMDHMLPMTQRERIAMTEVYRLRKELEDGKKKVAKDRSRTSGDS